MSEDENTENQNTESDKTSNPYDALFKEVMTELFRELQIPIKTEQEVSRKPRTIDIVITCTQEDIEKAKCETTFDFFTTNNIIAFKSPSDRMTLWEYHKIIARAHFYIAENKLATKNAIICAVCSSEPKKVLHESQDTVEFTMINPWHYVSNEKIPFHVVVIRKLKTEYKNYPLLLFAPMRKFKEFVKHAILNNRLKYLEYAYLLHPQITTEVLMMTGNIPIPEENVEFIVKDLTPERILRHIDLENLPEENVKFIVKDLTPERILRHINLENLPEENVKFIVKDLTPERILRHINLENLPEENVKFIVEDLTPERILQYIDVEDRLSGVNPEDLQKLSDVLLKSFNREELKKFLNILNNKINGDE